MPTSVGTIAVDVHVTRTFWVAYALVWSLVAMANLVSRLLPKLVKVEVLKSYHVEERNERA